ncbi:MAG TPA: NAD-dependent epimerase/dehydratase family protein [Candidatus Paceibacterota bacterium]|nr:NAD-dependent epimerase/dehydratase family protein [Candidatus Paceibacterota bacterium]
MKTLITGVPGWLGNRFLAILTDPNEPLNKRYNASPDRQIVCLVLPGLAATMPKLRNVTYVEGDITKPESLAGKLAGVDLVYHLAGIIHPKKIQELYDINAAGTKNLLDEAIRAKVRRFVYVSSNSVAGMNPSRDALFTEESPLNPYLNYGKSKALAEKAVIEASHAGAIETVVFRPCWFYGPNQPARQTRFFRMIAAGNPIVFGDGRNLRSMSYVDNTIQAFLLSEKSAQAANQTYWIADARPYETLEVYGTVARLLGVELKPRFVPGLASEVCALVDKALQALGFYIQEFHVAGEMNKHIACSTDKAARELGYKPEVSLEEGMRRSIEWCKQHGQLP